MPCNKANSRIHDRPITAELEPLRLQNSTPMSLPRDNWPFTHHIPDDDPTFCIAGDEAEVVGEEMQGVDWGCMAAEDVCWRCGGLLLGLKVVR